MSQDKCPDCGAWVTGGQTGCQAMYDEIAVRAYTDLHYAAVRDLAFDTYCMQHPDTYGRSAKSYAAHLTRLCCGVEYGGDLAVYAAIQKWLSGRVALEKPEILSFRGSMTIADVWAAQTAETHVKVVQAWARNVWQAYASQHQMARAWVRAALGE